jgi:hypothetical protein
MDEFKHVYEEKSAIPDTEQPVEPEKEQIKNVLVAYTDSGKTIDISKATSDANVSVSSFYLGQDLGLFEGKDFHAIYLVDCNANEFPDNIHGLFLTSVLKNNGPIVRINTQD